LASVCKANNYRLFPHFLLSGRLRTARSRCAQQRGARIGRAYAALAALVGRPQPIGQALATALSPRRRSVWETISLPRSNALRSRGQQAAAKASKCLRLSLRVTAMLRRRAPRSRPRRRRKRRQKRRQMGGSRVQFGGGGRERINFFQARAPGRFSFVESMVAALGLRLFSCFGSVGVLNAPSSKETRAALRGTAKAVLKAAAAFTPISQRLSPLVLGRITSFAEHCETVRASDTLCTQGLLSSNHERRGRTADSSHLPHTGRTLCVLVAGRRT